MEKTFDIDSIRSRITFNKKVVSGHINRKEAIEFNDTFKILGYEGLLS